MRLTEYQKNAIKQKALEFFGSNAQIYVFGSRIDDTKRGGDIDIYIESLGKNGILDAKIKYLIALEKELGEQKIDVIVDDGMVKKGIFDIAKKEGIRL